MAPLIFGDLRGGERTVTDKTNTDNLNSAFTVSTNFPNFEEFFSSVCNNNARRALLLFRHLCLLVLGEMETYMLSGQEGDAPIRNITELLRVIRKDLYPKLRHRRYRLMQVMLNLDRNEFENRTSVDVEELAAHRFKEGEKGVDPKELISSRDEVTMLMDNIFNYHINRYPKRNSDQALVEKIRILQIISLRDERLTLEEIEDSFSAFWGVESPFLEDSIVILVKTRCVSAHARRANDGSIRLSYGILPLGRVMFVSMCCQMSYVEQVFHHTFFPPAIIEKCARFHPLERQNWPLGAIINSYILLQFLRFVERRARAHRNVGRTQFEFANLMAKNLIHSVDRMVERDNRDCDKKIKDLGPRKNKEVEVVLQNSLVSRSAIAIGAIRRRWMRSDAAAVLSQ